MSKGLDKELTLQDLKAGWNTIGAKYRKELIYSLLGHRLSLKTIAEKISQSFDDVKAAYKGTVDASVKATPITSTEDCGHSNGYQGIVAPSCAGGLGCKTCWTIYTMNHDMSDSFVDPKVAEVAPVKTMYVSLTFDDLLDKYRQWINWDQHANNCPTPGTGPNDPEYLNGIIISDIHAPFHDEMRFAKMINDTKGKVDICILGGDGPDFHNYSKYMKYGQHFTMKDEHKSYMAVLATLSESYPEVVVIPGNHDERTRKKYAGLLPADLYQSLLEFHGPNAFDFAELMTRQFENIIIPAAPKDGFAEYRFVYQIFDIVVGHPEVYSRIPNKSVGGFIDWIHKKAIPMGLLQAPVTAAVMGHTHMAGKTWNDYAVVGIENGCICMTPDYDSGAKLCGAPRPLTRGYTRFRTNKTTGITSHNDIQFIELE